ncbi:Vacuolar morphogenesis protein 6 [Linderina pennispora]|nr:Vacuolar morphogenesis protein 6 [Linderina pennispora]
MHIAFGVRPVLKQLPVRIECAATYGDRLLLGTSTGALLVYRITEPTPTRALSVTLLDTKKAFARRAVEQLEVIKEANVLVCLSDSLVTLYDLQTLSDTTPLNNTKGASLVAVHTSVDHIDGIPTLVSKLAVHAKRRVLVFEWRDAEFYKSFEYSAAERIIAMQFCASNLLALSSAKEFLTLQLPEGQWDDLFPADTSSLRTLAGGLMGGPAMDSAPAAGSGSATNSGSMWGSWAIGLAGSGGGLKTLIRKMPGEKLLLCHEDVGVFINAAGKLCSREYTEPMLFSQPPVGITYTSAYVVAVSQAPAAEGTRHNVEVRNIATQALVQTLLLSEEEPLRALNGAGGKQVWAIGQRTVWRLMPAPIEQQVEEVLKAGQYDEALSLVAQADNILEDEKDDLTLKIRWLRARWLFRDQAQYEESLNEFTELGATPTEAIALCPERIAGELAEEYSDDGASTDTTPEAAEAGIQKDTKKHKQVVWREALYALMRYLTEHRRWLQRAMSESKRELEFLVRVFDDDDDNDDNDDDDNGNDDDGQVSEDGSSKFPSRDADRDDTTPHVRLKRLNFSLQRMQIPVAAMAQVVDTTLLKVYLECSPGLLGPLLRVKNFCDVEQSEQLLLDAQKYPELVDLYHGKGLYRNALQLLQSRGQDPSAGLLYGTYSTVRYLLRLPADQFELVLSYAKWPLQNRDTADLDAEDWPAPESVVSTVFADDRPAATAFPRARVALFLRDFSPSLVVQYLKYVFETWDDSTTGLHDDMVAAYLDMVSEKRSDAEFEGKSPRLIVSRDAEPRRSLQLFLRSSQHYSPERALARLPDDGLFEERALVLGRLGRNRHALSILVYSVGDLQLAEQYCLDAASAGVFAELVDILVSDPPSDITDLEAEDLRAQHPDQDLETVRRHLHRDFAGHLLSAYHHHIPANKALQMLPSDMPFTSSISDYLRKQLCTLDEKVRATDIVHNLRKAEDLQVRRRLGAMQAKRVIVTETRTCPHCLKRIGAGSAFAVIPPRKRMLEPSVVHYSCWQRHLAKSQEAAEEVNSVAESDQSVDQIAIKWSTLAVRD